MNNKMLRHLSIAALFLLSAAVASAANYTLASGASHEGRILKIFDGQVTIETAGGESVDVALANFDSASQSAIAAWASAHPDAVDVYSKWDNQPVIRSSSRPRLPNQFRDPGFKGMVSVELVLNEKGQVISAKVQKSTHAALEAPSVKAVKAWRFEPAKIGGKSVKSRLRVPFRFSHDSKSAG